MHLANRHLLVLGQLLLISFVSCKPFGVGTSSREADDPSAVQTQRGGQVASSLHSGGSPGINTDLQSRLKSGLGNVGGVGQGVANSRLASTHDKNDDDLHKIQGLMKPKTDAGLTGVASSGVKTRGTSGLLSTDKEKEEKLKKLSTGKKDSTSDEDDEEDSSDGRDKKTGKNAGPGNTKTEDTIGLSTAQQLKNKLRQLGNRRLGGVKSTGVGSENTFGLPQQGLTRTKTALKTGTVVNNDKSDDTSDKSGKSPTTLKTGNKSLDSTKSGTLNEGGTAINGIKKAVHPQVIGSSAKPLTALKAFVNSTITTKKPTAEKEETDKSRLIGKDRLGTNDATGIAGRKTVKTGTSDDTTGVAGRKTVKTGTSDDTTGVAGRKTDKTGTSDDTTGVAGRKNVKTGTSDDTTGVAGRKTVKTGTSDDTTGIAGRKNVKTGTSDDTTGVAGRQKTPLSGTFENEKDRLVGGGKKKDKEDTLNGALKKSSDTNSVKSSTTTKVVATAKPTPKGVADNRIGQIPLGRENIGRENDLMKNRIGSLGKDRTVPSSIRDQFQSKQPAGSFNSRIYGNKDDIFNQYDGRARKKFADGRSPGKYISIRNQKKIRILEDEDDARVKSSHFIIYGTIGLVLLIVLYIIYQKRQKILALIVEGRRQRGTSGSGERSRRGSGNIAYKPLLTNEEPADQRPESVQKYIY